MDAADAPLPATTSPLEPTPRQRATAYHEAGHAVIALSLGRPVRRVSIRPNELRDGVCFMGKGTFRPSDDVIETEMLILMAGLAAEARFTGKYEWNGAARDLRMVRLLAEDRGGSQRQVEKLERRMLDKVEHLLNRPGMWPAVELVAAELLKSTEISGRAARHFFDQALRSAKA